ncbi:MAG: hypothetical protein ACJ8H8_02045, partial [Geminicoccaceae bacterium]
MALTCAHVVRDHLGIGPATPAERPEAFVGLNFGALRRPVGARVAECGWFPDGTGADLEDIAVLILDEPLDQIPHAGIAPVDPPERAVCYTYGSLAAHTGIGQTAWAYITRNLNDSGWHQLDADASRGGYFVKRGFSGAPVMDPLGVTIWGMVAAVDKGAEDERRLVAFALPADALREAHLAVRRCARKSNRLTPDVTVRPDGPLDQLGRDTIVQLPTAVISVSGVDPFISTAGAAVADDLVDAVRAMAEAGADPAVSELAAAGLRGLQAGDTQAAERFFEARLQIAAESSRPSAGSASSPASDLVDASTAAQDARRLGVVLTLRDSARALAAFEQAAVLDPTDCWTWIEISRLAGQIGKLDESADAAERAIAAAGRADDDRANGAALAELGDMPRAQGDLPGALAAYTAAKDIRDKLAAADPGNAEWQRDLSISWNNLGNVRKAQGDLPGALAAYT